MSKKMTKEILSIITDLPRDSEVYVFGSFLRRDEPSDLDILVVGEEADVNRDQVLRIQESIDRQIQLTVLPHLDWVRMKKRKDRFAESILCNHVLIKGEEL